MELSRAFCLIIALVFLFSAFACESTGGDNDDDSGIAGKDDDAQADDDDNDIADDDDDNNETGDDDDDMGPFGCPSYNEDWTVGQIIAREGAYEGYTLFAPLSSTITYLIDMCGRVVHQWHSQYTPGHSVYLLEDGTLLRPARLGSQGSTVFTAGGAAGRIELYDWDGDLLWEYEYAGNLHLQHHDVEMLPTGNVLLLAWELKSQAEAVQAGVKPHLVTTDGLWPDHIVEVEPSGTDGGNIVWEWHLWDHLVQDYDPTKDNFGVVEDHPELVDLNMERQPYPDWMHSNAVDYHPEFDQIIISVRNFNEIWIIDHSTTTAQAAGHTGGNSGRGGDILYRWGNPYAYGAGTKDDQQYYSQHDAHWVEQELPGAGNILTFNNGIANIGREYSSVDEIIPPVNDSGEYTYALGSSFGPDVPVWSYKADTPEEFFSSTISGAQRQPNGTTLICSGEFGTIFEVTQTGQRVWMYISPVIEGDILNQGQAVPGSSAGWKNRVFRAYRYGADYPGLAGRDLTPGDFIEGQ